MNYENITIRETGVDDLENTRLLWNNGEVMRFVGFPNGIGVDGEYMVRWLVWVEKGRPLRNHYSVYEKEIGYCGETFYSIDLDHGNAAAMDIKLFPCARGRGIAQAALSFAIDRAFQNGAAYAWVDPSVLNEKALALYRKLRFVEKPKPAYLRENEMEGGAQVRYFELQNPDNEEGMKTF
ncbi:MAG: GNAT family N-acetyltransferase [Eubacteriales bacterium]|nr:GNAT family N-acetyltransferase [Eubacteriales bacterium]